MKHVLIIGSGLAGLSSAVRLVDAGLQVTVLEKQPFLGGRTSSWNDNGMRIESGFHRFLGFYTELPELLDHVGIKLDDIVCWEDEVEIRAADGQQSTLGLAPLHKPFKTAWSSLGHSDLLPPSDKLALAKMFASAIKDFEAKPDILDTLTVTEYAKRHGVSETAIFHLLTPLTDGIFFVSPDKYSMFNFMGLFMPYKTRLHALRVGAFTPDMYQAMIQPLKNYIERKGAEVKANQPITKLLVQDNRVVGAATRNKEYRSDHIILTTSLKPAQTIIKTSGLAHALPSMMQLQSMPSVTFQIELTEPSMELDRTTFGPGTILASFAEQSRTTFPESKGRLSIILSNPQAYIDTPNDTILKLVVKDLKKLGINIAHNVIDYRKVVIPHDFYWLGTGSEALRPTQQTPIPGLTLAGDYTKQQYLATMEGAVYSGKLAANHIINQV